jgi:phage terminase large subunit
MAYIQPGVNIKDINVGILYPPQVRFCQSKAKYTLYGGARGGGKSYVVRIKALQLAFKYPGITIYILRRTLMELESNHLEVFRNILSGIAKYDSKRYTFRVPVGHNKVSIIKFGYCNTDKDVEPYQGQNIECMFMDEATHFTEHMFIKFTECLRLSGNVDPKLGLKPRMYLTANPGGVGHTWVKRLFIDRQYRTFDNDGKTEYLELPEDYAFIPAKVTDNLFLMENNPEYIRQLKALPPKERAAMLDGDWNVFEGQFFTEFDEELHTFDPNKFDYDEEKNEYIPFKIQPNWRIYRARDYGLDKTACYWAALSEDGTMYIYRELWQSDLTVSDSGHLINKMTTSNELVFGDICPPDMWNRHSDTGKSSIQILIDECKQNPIKANNDRITGWLMVKEWLKLNPATGLPKLRISRDCVNLIHSLKMIQHDEKVVNDCAKEPHEITHSADALRYLCTSYTYTPAGLISSTTRTNESFADYALNRGSYQTETDDDKEDNFGFYDLNEEWIN